MEFFLIHIGIAAVKIFVIVFAVILPMVAYSVYAERRVSAVIQDRLGPNRVGWQGLVQPIADGLKFLLKEDFTPGHVNKFYYWLAPALALIPALLSVAVVPFGSVLNLDFLLEPLFKVRLGDIPMVIADLNVGVVYVFAITSLAVYGIVLAGWSSNSKYPFLGGVRSSSQMISYELSMGLAVIPIFLIIGKLNLQDIVQFQIDNGWLLFFFLPGGEYPWLVKLLLWVFIFISFIVFTISIFAETNRAPFDLPECEQELVAGYHTEYSSMKFALFFLGEYAAMIVGSSIVVTLFLGGWSLPFVPDGSAGGWAGLFWGLVNIAVFFGKVIAFILFFIWVRWTVPRFRFDQFMKLGWVYFFEIATANVFLVAAVLAFVPGAVEKAAPLSQAATALVTP
jgi:NADH-quinone oxidoreductase subunit H